MAAKMIRNLTMIHKLMIRSPGVDSFTLWSRFIFWHQLCQLCLQMLGFFYASVVQFLNSNKNCKIEEFTPNAIEWERINPFVTHPFSSGIGKVIGFIKRHKKPLVTPGI